MFKLLAPKSSTEGKFRLMSCQTLEVDYFRLDTGPYQQPFAEPLGNLIPDVFDLPTLLCIRSSPLLLQVFDMLVEDLQGRGSRCLNSISAREDATPSQGGGRQIWSKRARSHDQHEPKPSIQALASIPISNCVGVNIRDVGNLQSGGIVVSFGK